MAARILAKSCYNLSLFLGIIFLSFVLFHLVPSDPARIILGANASTQQVEQLRLELGLEKPVPFQLADYFRRALTLDFGKSYIDGRQVFREVLQRLGISLALLALAAIFLLLYLILVVLSPLFPPLGKFVKLVDFLLSSQPVFFSGVLISLLSLYYYPITDFSGRIASVNDLLYLLPPAFVVAMYPMAILSEILREQLAVALKSGYFIAARALGYSHFDLLYKHSLKNCLVPVLAALSNILPSLLTGAFIVEIMFSLPGIGSILLSSVLERDFPMLECTIIVNGAFFILLNFLFELLYPLVDPRIAEMKGNNDVPV